MVRTNNGDNNTTNEMALVGLGAALQGQQHLLHGGEASVEIVVSPPPLALLPLHHHLPHDQFLRRVLHVVADRQLLAAAAAIVVIVDAQRLGSGGSSSCSGRRRLTSSGLDTTLMGADTVGGAATYHPGQRDHRRGLIL